MRDLLSKRVVTVTAEERASDVSALIRARDASHCVVVEKSKGAFLGVVRLRELAAQPESRIFADLLSSLPTIYLDKRVSSANLNERLEKAKLDEAAVFSSGGKFVGLVTRESLQAWQRERRVVSHLAARKRADATTARRLAKKVKAQAAALREVIAQLNEFSYAIAHEMRTPLRAVRGYALTLEEEFGPRLEESGRDYLRRIVQASDRLDRLTKGVMLYREIATVVLRIRKVNTKRILSEAIAAALVETPSAKIVLEKKIPALRADPAQLRQCFAHILENAIKFVPSERGPEIRIFAERSGKTASICFEDNGIGLRAEHRERIFQLFEQVNTVAPSAGLGVGLAVARKAVERMHGKISAASDGQKGSCFRITLPV